MPARVNGKVHHTNREGGRPKADEKREALPKPAKNKSRADEHPGQGSEGFSKGYGGSAGSGATGPSGPEDDETK